MARRDDLRVRRTRAAIRAAFEDMICEYDYGSLTVSELASRAHINRKTFYLHYQSIDELMDEIVEDMVTMFTSRPVSYASLDDIAGIVRVFLETAFNQSPVHERILCEPSYRPVFDRVNRQVMAYRREHNKDALGLDELSTNIVYAYFAANSAILYRQWVADGKRLPLAEFTELAVNLICHGMASVVPDAPRARS